MKSDIAPVDRTSRVRERGTPTPFPYSHSINELTSVSVGLTHLLLVFPVAGTVPRDSNKEGNVGSPGE
jgi:hypothetical protein